MENRQNVVSTRYLSSRLTLCKKKKKKKENTGRNYTIYDTESREKFHRENIAATEKQIFFIPPRIQRDIFLNVSDYKSIPVYEARRWWFFLEKFTTFSSRMGIDMERRKKKKRKKRNSSIEYFSTNNGRKQYATTKRCSHNVRVSMSLAFVCVCGALGCTTVVLPIDFIRTKRAEIKVSPRSTYRIVFRQKARIFEIFNTRWSLVALNCIFPLKFSNMRN